MSENVESNPSGESPDSPVENSTAIVAEGPATPFARVKGRIVLPDGKPVRSGVVVFDPIPDRVHVTLPDGSSMIGSRVRLELDKDGRITSDENPYVDIVGCDTDGVTPAGVWSYLIRVSTGGITRRAVKSLKAGSSYDLSDLLSGKEEESSSGASEELAKLIDERLKKFETDKTWSQIGTYEDHDGTEKIGFIESENLQTAWDTNTVFLANRLIEIADTLKQIDDFDQTGTIGFRDAVYSSYLNSEEAKRYGLTNLKKYDGVRPGTLSEEDKTAGKVVAKPVEEANQYFPNENRETGLTIPEQLRAIADILLSHADAINEVAVRPTGTDIDTKTYKFTGVNDTITPNYGRNLVDTTLPDIIAKIANDNDRFGQNVAAKVSSIAGSIVNNVIDENNSELKEAADAKYASKSDLATVQSEVKSITPDPKTNRIWKGVAGFAADDDDNAGLVFDDPINEVSWALAPYSVGGGLTLSCQTIRPNFSENIDYVDVSNYPEVFRVEVDPFDTGRINNNTIYTTFFGNVILRSDKNVIRSRTPSDPEDVTTKKYVDDGIKKVTSKTAQVYTGLNEYGYGADLQDQPLDEAIGTLSSVIGNVGNYIDTAVQNLIQPTAESLRVDIDNVTSEGKFEIKRIDPVTGNVKATPGKSSIEDLVAAYNELAEFVASQHGSI